MAPDRPEEVTASSTSSTMTQQGGLTWQSARARIATCAYGSERFAEALVATLYDGHHPPR